MKHKKSARYFINNWRNSKNKAKQQVGGGEMVSIAVRPYVMGSHATCSGAWASGPEDYAITSIVLIRIGVLPPKQKLSARGHRRHQRTIPFCLGEKGLLAKEGCKEFIGPCSAGDTQGIAQV